MKGNKGRDSFGESNKGKNDYYDKYNSRDRSRDYDKDNSRDYKGKDKDFNNNEGKSNKDKDYFDYKGSVRDFTKRLALQETFFDKTWEDDSLVRKPSKKYFTTKNSDLNSIINTVNRIEPVPISNENNITFEEKKAMDELKKLTRETLEIKKADKSDVWVIMDKDEYCEKLVLKEHLETSTYKLSTSNINKTVSTNLKNLIMKHGACLTKTEMKYVLDDDWTDAHFYFLPKITKSGEIVSEMRNNNQEYVEMKMPETLKSRPICGVPNAVTQGASKRLNEILSPLVNYQQSYIKDEWDFVKKLPSKVESKYKLLSCDIKSLYPSIPTELAWSGSVGILDRQAWS